LYPYCLGWALDRGLLSRYCLGY